MHQLFERTTGPACPRLPRRMGATDWRWTRVVAVGIFAGWAEGIPTCADRALTLTSLRKTSRKLAPWK